MVTRWDNSSDRCRVSVVLAVPVFFIVLDFGLIRRGQGGTRHEVDQFPTFRRPKLRNVTKQLKTYQLDGTCKYYVYLKLGNISMPVQYIHSFIDNRNIVISSKFK